MAVDTTAAVTVDRRRDAVAAYLWDPANDQEWIGGLRSARLVTPAPVRVGSRVQRVASFLGRRVEYLNEITELTPDRLAMRSVRAPFPMRITYQLRDAGGGATEVAVRIEGDTGRFYALAGPFLARAVHRSVSRDLRVLKQVLEARTRPVPPR
jgi:Polyketide cyclase / dehydrase and lipid transport